MLKYAQKETGFTIVELLVAIVVIGVLAAITIVSYTGISGRAKIASLQSDLTNGSKQLKLSNTTYGSFPDTIDCSQSDSATNKCIKSSGSNVLTYSKSISGFALAAVNGDTCYSITNDSSPSPDCVVIGQQIWGKYNLNVGTPLAAGQLPIADNNVEKYCYMHTPGNCNTYGGLYTWDEMMDYKTTEANRGICPIGYRVPTDTDWKTLEVYLGMTQAQADATGWRGTDQGTKLKVAGSSHFEGILGSYYNGTNFSDLNWGNYWTSTQTGASAYQHGLHSSMNNVYRNTSQKTNSYSLRCIAG